MGDENLIFGDFIYIVVDQGQNLYVLDSKNHRILKFDKTGKFLWRAGRKGQGPGEFQNPHKIKVTGENHVAVMDKFFEIHFFNPDGQYLNTIKPGKMLWNMEFLKDGRILISIWAKAQAGYSAEFYTKDGFF